MAAALLIAGGVTAGVYSSTERPPACARADVQETFGMTALNECLDEVAKWCEDNYPEDGACKNKVFGYDPRPLGQD